MTTLLALIGFYTISVIVTLLVGRWSNRILYPSIMPPIFPFIPIWNIICIILSLVFVIHETYEDKIDQIFVNFIKWFSNKPE